MLVPQSGPLPDDVPLEQRIARDLQQAISHHQAGNLREAEGLYRSILSQQPGHSDANHNLGVLLVATGHAAEALPHFQAAIAANPSHAQFWLSCIDALIRVSQIDAAREMLALGVRSGLSGGAVEALQRRLQGQPSADGRGTEKQKSLKAPKSLKAAKNRQKHLARQPSAPTQAEAEKLAALLKGRRDQELVSYAKSLISRYPKSGYAWNTLGALHQLNRRFPDAENCYRSAVKAEPGYADAHFNLGLTLQAQASLAEAEACYRKAIELRPSFLRAHYSLAETLDHQGRYAESECCYRQAIAIQPDLAAAHNNLAIALRKQNRPGESEASSRRAIELDPQLAHAWCSLGAALQEQGRLPEAAASYRRAVEIRPDLAVAHHGLLFCLSHGGEAEPQAIFNQHLRFAEQFEAPLKPSWPRHQNSRDPDRQLRIGFVSGDFRDHSMASFIEPVFAHLAQHPELSLHAYSNHAAEDAVTLRLRSHIHHWNRIFALSDEMLAAKIQADGIDILVDLTGHTAGNRLLTFARKPAPIQCGWIGYLGTSGLKSIDYYLADRYFLPPGEFDRYFTEKIHYLPAVAPFQPHPHAPAIGPLPALTAGHLTFASFSRISKLNPGVIALWSQLLRALPESEMLIAAMPQDGRHQAVSEWFQTEGIAPERLQFHPRCDYGTYFALHHQADICLDPFPFTGATTTAHALWMGLPTLTLTGQTVPGRLGPALLLLAGLQDFVAHTPREFVEKGTYWAHNLDSLAELRAGMRERLLRSPICQPALVADSLAAGFREMWQIWCAGVHTPS